MRAFVTRLFVLLLIGFVLTATVGCSSSPTTGNTQPAATTPPASGPGETPKGKVGGKQADAPKHIGEN